MSRNRIVFFPYKMGSKSCKELAIKLDALRVRTNGRYRPRSRDLIINWGNSHQPTWNGRILNDTGKVKIATNKLSTFQVLRDNGVSVPNFTTDPEIAREWDRVVLRYNLIGSGGKGIKIIYGDEVYNEPKPKLYVEYLGDDKKEYRVHVFNDHIIDYSKKIFGGEIASYELGAHFVRHGIERIASIQNLAIEAVNALELDFGAVDIVRVGDDNYVLEINTAPGLSEEGLDRYASAIGSLTY